MTDSRFVYTASLEDVVAAFRLHRRRRGRGRVAWTLVWVVVVVEVVWFSWLAFERGGGYLAPAMMWVVLAALVVQRAVWIPYWVGRVYREQKSLRREYAVELSDDALHCTSEQGAVRQPWTDFIRWREDERLILLYQSRAMFQIFPKESMGSGAVDRMRSLLDRHLGPAA